MSDDKTENAENTEKTEANIIGEVDPKILETVRRLQHQTQQVTFEIGNLEVRKAQLLGNLDNFNQQAQNLLRKEGARLEIPPNTKWYIDDQGRAVAVK